MKRMGAPSDVCWFINLYTPHKFYSYIYHKPWNSATFLRHLNAILGAAGPHPAVKQQFSPCSLRGPFKGTPMGNPVALPDARSRPSCSAAAPRRRSSHPPRHFERRWYRRSTALVRPSCPTDKWPVNIAIENHQF